MRPIEQRFPSEKVPDPKVEPGVLQRLGASVRRNARAAMFGAGLLLGADQLLAAPPSGVKPGHKPPSPNRPVAAVTSASSAPAWAQQLAVKEDQRVQARALLNRALQHPAVREYATEAARMPDLIFALMVKESALRQNARSAGGAQGITQVLDIARREVERRYGVKLDRSSPIENATCGVLYFQTRLDDARRMFPDEPSLEGRANIALLDYNAGPRMLERLKRPGDTYETFSLRVEQQFARAVGANPQQRLYETDPVYGVRYRVPAGLRLYRERGGLVRDVQGVSVRKLAEALPYPRIIRELATRLTAPPPSWVAPTSGTGVTVERVTEKRRLWSISREQLGFLVNRLPGYTQRLHGDIEVSAQVHRAFMQAIVRYNATHAPHSTANIPESPDPNIPVGTDLVIPGIPYLQKAMGEIFLADASTDPRLRRAYLPRGKRTAG